MERESGEYEYSELEVRMFEAIQALLGGVKVIVNSPSSGNAKKKPGGNAQKEAPGEH